MMTSHSSPMQVRTERATNKKDQELHMVHRSIQRRNLMVRIDGEEYGKEPKPVCSGLRGWREVE